jgi:NADPH:quinone reductase-like Zn-dependent oxidoreductase
LKAFFFHDHGDVDVLEYGDFPTPGPGQDQVLIRLKAAALNRPDLWCEKIGPGKKDFKTVMELVFFDHLIPILDQTYPLSAAGAAQRRLARGNQLRKITLAID